MNRLERLIAGYLSERDFPADFVRRRREALALYLLQSPPQHTEKGRIYFYNTIQWKHNKYTTNF
jgi:hypothetical protein